MFLKSKSPEQIEQRRRFWRRARRRFFWTLAVLFVAHSGLNIYASVLLNRELAAIRQKGEPLQFAEMAPPAVPDSQNAALVYKQAFDSLRFSPQEKRAFNTRPRARTPQMNQNIEAALRKNQNALDLTRRAASMPQCRFPLDYGSDNPTALHYYYDEPRELARLLALKAVLEAKNGDGAAALRDVRAIFGMAHHLTNEPTIMGFWIAQDIDVTANQALAQVLKKRPLTVAEAHTYQSSLPANNWNRAFRRSLMGERSWGVFVFERLRQPFGGTVAPDLSGEVSPLWVSYPVRLLWRPILKLDEVQLLRLWKSVLDSRLYQQVPSSVGSNQSLVVTFRNKPLYAMLTNILFPFFFRASDFRDFAEVGRRQREAALALASYRTARGHYPARLEEVASLWGKPLPLDPYSNEPFVYRREGKGFRLYSVGVNRTDDGGRNFQDQNASRSWNAYDDISWGNSSHIYFQILKP